MVLFFITISIYLSNKNLLHIVNSSFVNTITRELYIEYENKLFVLYKKIIDKQVIQSVVENNRLFQSSFVRKLFLLGSACLKIMYFFILYKSKEYEIVCAS